METCSEPGCERKHLARGLCASHYNTARMKALRRSIRDEVRRCRRCGSEFSGRSAGAVFCSKECKASFHVAAGAARRAEARVGRRCVQCGEVFESVTAKAQCCSKSCSVAWQNAKRQAAKRAAWLERKQPCASCGGEISDDGRTGRRYCSFECKKREMSRRSRERAPHYMREYLYGITADQYTAMLATQGNACAICRTDSWPGKHNKPHVDHDHATGAVRGILCGLCNNGLGSFRDDPMLLRAAADYLEV